MDHHRIVEFRVKRAAPTRPLSWLRRNRSVVQGGFRIASLRGNHEWTRIDTDKRGSVVAGVADPGLCQRLNGQRLFRRWWTFTPARLRRNRSPALAIVSPMS